MLEARTLYGDGRKGLSPERGADVELHARSSRYNHRTIGCLLLRFSGVSLVLLLARIALFVAKPIALAYDPSAYMGQRALAPVF